MLYSWISVIIFEYGVGLTVVSRYPILEADFTVYHEHGPYAGKMIPYNYMMGNWPFFWCL